MEEVDHRDVAARKIRVRLASIENEIDDEITAQDVAYTRDYEFRMSDARLEALRHERERLKEVMGDL